MRALAALVVGLVGALAHCIVSGEGGVIGGGSILNRVRGVKPQIIETSALPFSTLVGS